MNKKTLIESFAELQEAKDKLLKELLNNFNYYKKYKNLKNQQKEFIKYLEDEIEKATTNPYTKLSEYGMNRIHIYKEILQKHKEMVGVSDENKTNV